MSQAKDDKKMSPSKASNTQNSKFCKLPTASNVSKFSRMENSKSLVYSSARSPNNLTFPSDAPTALLAPSDYQNYYTNKDKTTATAQKASSPNGGTSRASVQKKSPASAIAAPVVSDVPTILIAPKDYKQYFTISQTKMQETIEKKKAANAQRVSSDVPTMLLTPLQVQERKAAEEKKRIVRSVGQCGGPPTGSKQSRRVITNRASLLATMDKGNVVSKATATPTQGQPKPVTKVVPTLRSVQPSSPITSTGPTTSSEGSIDEPGKTQEEVPVKGKRIIKKRQRKLICCKGCDCSIQ